MRRRSRSAPPRSITTSEPRGRRPRGIALLPLLLAFLSLLSLGAGWLPSSASAQAIPAQRRVRADGIAALIGTQASGVEADVILISDVYLYARILLAGRSQTLPLGSLPEGLLAAALEELIGEVLIAREARRLQAETPSAAEVEVARGALAARAGGEERLVALTEQVGADAEEVEALIRRRASVDAFLRANLQTAAVLDDAEVQEVYERGGHPFVGRELDDDVRAGLRAWLLSGRVRRQIQRWIEVLGRRTPVRRLVGWRRSE